MKKHSNFSEILDEKMKDFSHCDSIFYSEFWNFHDDNIGDMGQTEYLHMSQIIGNTSKKNINLDFSSTIYKQYQTPRRPRPKHNLNKSQKESLQFLRQYSDNLMDNFNLKELKTAYRQAVLKTHPDRGGISHVFNRVLLAYKCLLGVFHVNESV